MAKAPSHVVSPVQEIRRLYFETAQQSVEPNLQRAIELFKSLTSEEDRERAAVYMDGLSQMRSEWASKKPARATGRQKPRR